MKTFLLLLPALTLMNSPQPGSEKPESIRETLNKVEWRSLINEEKGTSSTKEDTIILSKAERQAVIQRASTIDKSTTEKFHKLLDAWCKEINTNPEMALSSNTKAYTTLPKFKELTAMGKGIIPLIMKELLDEKKFYLLELYDALQENPQLKVAYNDKDATFLRGEQDRAKSTIRMWLKGNKITSAK